jgi:hypothetical protein
VDVGLGDGVTLEVWLTVAVGLNVGVEVTVGL